MGDVVNLKSEAIKRESCVWSCDCGNCAFLIHDNGNMECSDCGEFQYGEVLNLTLRAWTRKCE